MVADGAAAHQLEAEKIELVKLTAYAPELNPVERFFEQLRSQLKFCVVETLDEAKDYLTKVLEKYFKQPELVKSMTLYSYIKHAHLNLN
jgi:transposase